MNRRVWRVRHGVRHGVKCRSCRAPMGSDTTHTIATRSLVVCRDTPRRQERPRAALARNGARSPDWRACSSFDAAIPRPSAGSAGALATQARGLTGVRLTGLAGAFGRASQRARNLEDFRSQLAPLRSLRIAGNAHPLAWWGWAGRTEPVDARAAFTGCLHRGERWPRSLVTTWSLAWWRSRPFLTPVARVVGSRADAPARLTMPARGYMQTRPLSPKEHNDADRAR